MSGVDAFKAFEKRLKNSIINIERKLKDKEANNSYFLILYELPYIFCDGKIIAGFVQDSQSSSAQYSNLIEQPLNTLHLTERVLKKRDDGRPQDHFLGILEALSLENGKKALTVDPCVYQIQNRKAGVYDLKCPNDPVNGQYKESDKDSILNYCDYPIHTGKLEGVNNKIKVIKRRAYGFHDLRYFTLKIYQAFAN